MTPEVIPFEWSRILLGEDTSAPLLLEFAFRTALIFFWLLLLIRLTGKRGLSQLSPLEFAIVIALGSAAGDPMMYAEVPLLPAMLVIALVIGLQRLVSHVMLRHRGFEVFVDGKPLELVRDGVIVLPNLKKARFTLEDLFERLRPEGIYQLGEIQYAYLEQGATLSVFQYAPDKVRPGLAIVPPWSIQPPSPVPVGHQGPVACRECGRVFDQPVPTCDCGKAEWTLPVEKIE